MVHVSFVPTGLRALLHSCPRLAPWAAFFRRFAAFRCRTTFFACASYGRSALHRPDGWPRQNLETPTPTAQTTRRWNGASSWLRYGAGFFTSRGCPVQALLERGFRLDIQHPASLHVYSSQTSVEITAYSSPMPWGLKRFQEARQVHFLTFSCYHRKPKLAEAEACATFVSALERVRLSYQLCVYGYVIMPEHVHLLVNEPSSSTLAQAVKSLKQGVARRLALRDEEPFWQARYYDFNVWSERKFVEKLRYLHRNPVKRGLVTLPEDWPWSSFRHYATGESGAVEIESQWTARKRERSGVFLTMRENPRSSGA